MNNGEPRHEMSRKPEGHFDRTITDKEGKDYFLFLREQGEFSIPFDVQFDLVDPDTGDMVGRVVAWEEEFFKPKIPKNFLKMPEELFSLPFYRSEVIVKPNWQGKGLGKQLADVLQGWLSQQDRDLVHLIFFTDEGLKALASQFLQNGYVEAEVTNEFLASQFTGSEQKVWIYKRYSETKR